MTLIIHNVPEELHKNLKILAIEEEFSLNELVLDILYAYVKRYEIQKPILKKEIK